jgi:CRP-like cAMP-binding protein
VTLDISRTYSGNTDDVSRSVIATGLEYQGGSNRMRNIRPFPDRRPISNRILRDLPRTALDKISIHLRSVDLRRDDYLYRPEDLIEYIYFPETVVLSDYQMLDDGRTIEIALTGNESAVGLASVFGHSEAVNWTQVCAAGTALKIESELFRNIIGRESAVKELFNDHLNAYVRLISHKVICSTHHSVEERLCAWLLMLADRQSDMHLKLTHEQIARVLGVYRPSVTCIAQGLKERGVIEYVRGKIIITDREKLERSACPCYSEFSARPATIAAHTFRENFRQM